MPFTEADRRFVRGNFPHIDEQFVVTSVRDTDYNCIAWAADDTERHWWPGGTSYWPNPTDAWPTVAAFKAVFKALGYEECATGGVEKDFEKVSIYIDNRGYVTHMARQLQDGNWTSKLGYEHDIQHVAPECLRGQAYGEPHAFMRRPRGSP